MKKKLSVLLFSAVLCVTAFPANGLAADFGDEATTTEDIFEEADESSRQEEAENTEDAETVEYEDTEELEIGETEQAGTGSNNSENFTDSGENFSDGGTAENGNIILSHDGIIQEGALSPKKTSAVLKEEWENSLVSLVEENSSVLDISALAIPAEQISDVVMLFINKHPEYYWLSFESCDVENGIAVTLYEDAKPSMGRSRSSIFGSSSFEYAAEKALSVVQPGMSNLEKALALHDYIVLNAEYDYQGVMDDELPDSDYTAEGILVKGKGVCQGYALAYQYLLGKVGIESKYVASAAMQHGWNLVKIDGQWYHVDATWDDPVWDQLGRVRHQYFMLSDSAIRNLEHDSWEAWNGGTETAPLATSGKYDNFFWKNIDTGIWYYQGKWYYMEINTTKGTDIRIGKVKCQKILDSSATVISTLSMKWPYVGNPNAYWGNSAKTVLDNGKFYYSGPDAIYQMNLDGSGTVKVADVKYTDEYVYGFALVNGAFWISVKENPNIDAEETPIKITLKSSTTTVTPKPTATPITTPKPADNGTVITRNTYKNYSKPALRVKKTIRKIENNAFENLHLERIYFEGNAPQIGTDIFKNQTLTAYYPLNNSTWTADKMKNYGGTRIIWSAWNPETGEVYGADLKKYGELKLQYTTRTYNGKAQKMKVYVQDKSYTGSTNKMLRENTDYKVTWKNNVNAGTATVTVTGVKPRFRGTLTKTFKIVPAVNSITAANVKKTQSTKTQTFYLGAKVKDKAKLSYTSGSKKVTVNSNGKVTIAANYTGKVAVTITAAATRNYKASKKTVTITVIPSATTITKCTTTKTGKADIQWKKNSFATGYEIQYSTDKTFKNGVKTKTITKASTTKCTITGLANKRTYYIRIRTYKSVGKQKLYSSWG